MLFKLIIRVPYQDRKNGTIILRLQIRPFVRLPSLLYAIISVTTKAIDKLYEQNSFDKIDVYISQRRRFFLSDFILNRL